MRTWRRSVDEDVVEGAEQDEDDTDNAVDVQQDMDNWLMKLLVDGETTAYLELRKDTYQEVKRLGLLNNYKYNYL